MRLCWIFGGRLGFHRIFFGLGSGWLLLGCMLLIPHGLDELQVAEFSGESAPDVVRIAYEEAKSVVLEVHVAENFGQAGDGVGGSEFRADEIVVPGGGVVEVAGLDGLDAVVLPVVERDHFDDVALDGAGWVEVGDVLINDFLGGLLAFVRQEQRFHGGSVAEGVHG